jgi:hypothetical protein
MLVRIVRYLAWEDKRYGEAELRLLIYLVNPQRTAIDIGAAEGVYAFYLQKLARRCIAFEPNPESYAHLKCALPGVEIHHAAVSSVHGPAVLRVPVVNNVAYHGWGTIESKNSLAELPPHSIREIKVRPRWGPATSISRFGKHLSSTPDSPARTATS